jgi:hypothetical protein
VDSTRLSIDEFHWKQFTAPTDRKKMRMRKAEKINEFCRRTTFFIVPSIVC